MQVQFTPNELRLLNDTLARNHGELVREISRTEHREFKHELQQKLDLLARVQAKLARGTFDFFGNELDFLAETLEYYERQLYAEIARTDRREFKHELQSRLEFLAQAHRKISGACRLA